MRTKQILTFMLLLLTVLSCSKKEEFTGVRPDAQLKKVLEEYESQLAGSTNGWIAYLYPKGGGGYTFQFKFDRSNRVKMQAGYKQEYATTAKESSYRLRAAQVPSLYFDTYSYLHELADPDPSVLGGATGQGYLSDFEFSILRASPDTIYLKGNLNESELILVRANAQQGSDYMQKVYAKQEELKRITKFRYYHNKLTLGGKNYNITINPEQSTFNVYGAENNGAARNITYNVTESGLILREPFVDGDRRIERLDDLQIDLANNSLSAKLSDGTSIRTINEAAPVAVMKSTPRSMYNETYQYMSLTGFTVNGEVDGYKLSKFPGYVACLFVPRQYVDGYDAFHVFVNFGNTYITPIFNTEFGDGTIYFKNVLTYISSAGTDYLDIVFPFFNDHFTQLRDEAGYYVYQTGAKSYDLVSVRDAGIWMRLR